jgi:hypothetical protein
VDLTAAVERAHSYRARSGSKGTCMGVIPPFIVRVLRARRTPGRSLAILLRPRVARAQKIIRLHPVFPPTAFPTQGILPGNRHGLCE